ncbi:TetR/AcrR family transcriptional regulator [Streptomyces sp. KL116D]|uniref:TetR/AcrR family transcriptional regulator n=1 Tax=Streptomyces sp. KL116D TaxID=3045152 RepID=UPI0035580AC9
MDERVLQAARDELAERVAAFSMRGVAQRAGVSRPSLLLRWHDADTLIVDALDSLELPELPSLPGVLEQDLFVVADMIAEQLGSSVYDLQMRIFTDARDHPYWWSASRTGDLADCGAHRPGAAGGCRAR